MQKKVLIKLSNLSSLFVLIVIANAFAKEIYIPSTPEEVKAYWSKAYWSSETKTSEDNSVERKVYNAISDSYIYLVMNNISSLKEIDCLFRFIKYSDAAAEEFYDYLPILLKKESKEILNSISKMDKELKEYTISTIKDMISDDDTGLLGKLYQGLK